MPDVKIKPIPTVEPERPPKATRAPATPEPEFNMSITPASPMSPARRPLSPSSEDPSLAGPVVRRRRHLCRASLTPLPQISMVEPTTSPFAVHQDPVESEAPVQVGSLLQEPESVRLIVALASHRPVLPPRTLLMSELQVRFPRQMIRLTRYVNALDRKAWLSTSDVRDRLAPDPLPHPQRTLSNPKLHPSTRIHL